MINTVGIQSIGPQGLPQSCSPPKEVNPQAEDQFKQMMLAEPNNPSKLDELKSRYEAAKVGLDEAMQGGDPMKVLQAKMELAMAMNDLETATNKPNTEPSPGAVKRERGPYAF